MYQILFLKAFPGSFLIFVVSIQVYAIIGEQRGTDGRDESQESSENVRIVPVEQEESVHNDADDEDIESEENEAMFVDDHETITEEQLHRENNSVATEAMETFRCTVCHKNVVNQREFFIHLKSHYEPISGMHMPIGQYRNSDWYGRSIISH